MKLNVLRISNIKLMYLIMFTDLRENRALKPKVIQANSQPGILLHECPFFFWISLLKFFLCWIVLSRNITALCLQFKKRETRERWNMQNGKLLLIYFCLCKQHGDGQNFRAEWQMEPNPPTVTLTLSDLNLFHKWLLLHVSRGTAWFVCVYI